MNDSAESAMDRFPLRWRWTEREHSLLPPQDLMRIHPFGPSAASELCERSRDLIDVGLTGAIPNPKVFCEPDVLRDLHECDHVVEWLAERLPREPTAVVVSWDSQLAVHTDSGIVVKYWDSFFYPSSDDTLIWPSGEEWILAYFHEDTIHFATRRGRNR